MIGLDRRLSFPIACDSVVFCYEAGALLVALIQRKNPPFQNMWALPGGFLEANETIEEGARRELHEETGILNPALEIVSTYSDIDRDPRGRVISIAFMALVRQQDVKFNASADASQVQWFAIEALPELAFDHPKILGDALVLLRRRTLYRPMGRELLPDIFSLSELQSLYETILGYPLDKRNFRKKISKASYLIDTGTKALANKHRPPRLFTFDSEKYANALKEDLEFG